MVVQSKSPAPGRSAQRASEAMGVHVKGKFPKQKWQSTPTQDQKEHPPTQDLGGGHCGVLRFYALEILTVQPSVGISNHTLWNLLELSRTFQNFLESFRIFQNFQELNISGAFRNILEHSGTFQNIPEQLSRTFHKILNCLVRVMLQISKWNEK